MVHSWRAERGVACAPPPPPPMKGVWCSGCHSPRNNQGGAPEMGLIKGVGQGKQSQPTYTNLQCHMLGAGEVKGSQLGRVKVKVYVTRMRELKPIEPGACVLAT